MNKLYHAIQSTAVAVNVLTVLVLTSASLKADPWPAPSDCACVGCVSTATSCPATAGVNDCLTACECVAATCFAK